MPVIAGFGGPGFTTFWILLVAGFVIGWSAPAGLAGAVAGAYLARRRTLGWCAGWCAGAGAAGALAVLASWGAGVSGWALSAFAYTPVWVACAALVGTRRPTAPRPAHH